MYETESQLSVLTCCPRLGLACQRPANHPPSTRISTEPCSRHNAHSGQPCSTAVRLSDGITSGQGAETGALARAEMLCCALASAPDALGSFSHRSPSTSTRSRRSASLSCSSERPPPVDPSLEHAFVASAELLQEEAGPEETILALESAPVKAKRPRREKLVTHRSVPHNL